MEHRKFPDGIKAKFVMVDTVTQLSRVLEIHFKNLKRFMPKFGVQLKPCQLGTSGYPIILL